MKTTKILAIALLCWASLANAQDKKEDKVKQSTISDVQKAKKEEENKVKNATQHSGGNAKAEPGKVSQAPQVAPSPEEQKVWMEYSSPGPAQKMLSQGVGEWDETITFWMVPGGNPQSATSKCTISMILGDRYQKSVTKGMMMGMPFEGIGTVGYDNMLGEYQSTWMDNMGTGTMFLVGKYNEQTKTLESHGKMPDPTQQKEVEVRQVVTFVSPTEMKIEMFSTMEGNEFKNMEIVMKKVVKKK